MQLIQSFIHEMLIYVFRCILQVLEKVDRHWWYGCCGGKYGKFPGSYVLPVELPSLEESHELFAAVADFPCHQDGDLSFSKGGLFQGTKFENIFQVHQTIG
jgi:hypothetical protein